MSNESDIPRAGNFEKLPTREYADMDENRVPDAFEDNIGSRQAIEPKKPIPSYATRGEPRLKRIFETVKNTILAKNKTGKTLGGIAVAVIGVFTGINLEPLIQPTMEPAMTEFLTEINIYGVVGLLISIVLGYLKTKTSAKLDSVIDDAESGIDIFLKFKQKDSDGGEKVTEAEKDLIIEHFARIFEKQAKKAL